MGLCILISIISILVSVFNNSIDSIGKDLFEIFKESLLLLYFAKSKYVKEYLIK